MTSRIVKEKWLTASLLKRETMFKLQEMIAEQIKKFVWWHEDWVEDFADKYNLTRYQISWIGFFKGVVVVLFLQWLL